MIIKIASDLHLEFYNSLDRARILEEIDNTPGDVVVIAGDLTNFINLGAHLGETCDAFRGSEVVYVLGNHEYYGSDRKEMPLAIKTIRKDCKNLHILDSQNVSVINGIKFVGETMWFPSNRRNSEYKRFMRDFFEIKNFEPWVYTKNSHTKKFFSEEVNRNTVVVTHHLPTASSLAPTHLGNNLNRFFVSGWGEEIILRKQPLLWVHGHTHIPCGYSIGTTQVICNPRGYPNENPIARARYDYTFTPKCAMSIMDGVVYSGNIPHLA